MYETTVQRATAGKSDVERSFGQVRSGFIGSEKRGLRVDSKNLCKSNSGSTSIIKFSKSFLIILSMSNKT